MADNYRQLRYFVLILLFLGLSPFIGAQTAGYFIDPNSDEPRFIQRLTWSGGENALRYEVEIEKREGGSYQRYLREFTTALFIEVSLPPGEYRFRVIPHDALDRQSAGSQWTAIEVRPALIPELYGTSQEFIYSDNNLILALNINGNNFVPDAEIFLQDPYGAHIVPDKIEFRNSGNVRLLFDSRRLNPGEYRIVIRNPGGLESGMGGIIVAYPEPETEPEIEHEPEDEPEQEDVPEPEPEQGGLNLLKPIIINFGAAWTPVFPIYGRALDDGGSLLGGTANASAVFSIPLNVYIGSELTAVFYFNELSETGTMAVGVNLLMQKWLPRQSMAFNFRLGAGYVMDSKKISINMGVSFLLRAFSKFYAEAGLDYVNFNDYDSSGIPSGFFRPRLGFGVLL